VCSSDLFGQLQLEGSHTSTDEAEIQIRRDRPDVAFIGIGKNGINAFRLAAAFRGCNPHGKVIFLSDHVEVSDEAFECGGNGFLFRPYNTEKIEKLLGKYLSQSLL
ncbi:MAG: response regulator, partial [Clostridiales bacterium]|nr:response regulator [Clostridiales bacterium]